MIFASAPVRPGNTGSEKISDRRRAARLLRDSILVANGGNSGHRAINADVSLLALNGPRAALA